VSSGGSVFSAGVGKAAEKSCTNMLRTYSCLGNTLLYTHPQAGTGTWNGPAPKGAGSRPVEERQAAEQAKTKLPVSEPKSAFVGGADMPMIGFNTDAVDGEEVVRNAVTSGYRLFVSTPGSGKEAMIGKALQSCPRTELFMVSKLPNDCHKPDAIREACEKSLVDLACGYLDLYLMEWPLAWLPGTQEPDSTATLTETWYRCCFGLLYVARLLHPVSMRQMHD